MQVKDLCAILKSSKGNTHAFRASEIYSLNIEGGKVTVKADKEGMAIEMTVPVENAEFISKDEYDRRSNTWRYAYLP